MVVDSGADVEFDILLLFSGSFVLGGGKERHERKIIDQIYISSRQPRPESPRVSSGEKSQRARDGLTGEGAKASSAIG